VIDVRTEQPIEVVELRAVRPGDESAANVEIKQLHELREHEVQK
jgi:hypothetical protein